VMLFFQGYMALDSKISRNEHIQDLVDVVENVLGTEKRFRVAYAAHH